MEKEMDKMVIMDHYKFPHNKVKVQPQDYEAELGYNPSCGDKVTVYLHINDDHTIDLKWSGSGCSICCAASSMMCDELNGLSVDAAIEKIKEYEEMISGKAVNLDDFADAIALSGLDNFPSRFKCGYLSWQTALMMLLKHQQEN